MIGCIINRIPSLFRRTPAEIREEWTHNSRLLKPHRCRLIAAIPQNAELTACRTSIFAAIWMRKSFTRENLSPAG